MDTLPAEVECIHQDGRSVRYTSVKALAAEGNKISVQPSPAAGPHSPLNGREDLDAAANSLIVLERCHVRPVPPEAAVPASSSVCLDARQGESWVPVLPLGPEADGAMPVLYEATLEPGLVRVEDLRLGLDYIPEGPAAGWVPRAPCEASWAIKQRWVPLGVLNYIGIIQDDPKGNGDMRLWRPDARNDKRRLLMSTPHAAEAARWRDALEDARDQRARDGGVDRPTRARNFDASTWRLTALHLGLPPDKTYAVSLGPKEQPPSKPPARPRHPAAGQGGAAGGVKRSSIAQAQLPASKRHTSCSSGPGIEAPNSPQPQALRQGQLPSSSDVRHQPPTQNSPAAAAAAAAGAGGGRTRAAAGALGQGQTIPAAGQGCSADDDDGWLLVGLAIGEGGGAAGNGCHLSRAQLPSAAAQQQQPPPAVGGSAAMQRASSSSKAAAEAPAADGGRVGSKVHGWDGAHPGAAPAAAEGVQLAAAQGAAAHAGGSGRHNSSSQHSQRTPAAPSIADQHAAAAGSREVLRGPDGCVVGPGAPAHGSRGAATHPAPPSLTGGERGTAVQEPSAAGGTSSRLRMPPAAMLAPANNGQQQQQQVQMQAPVEAAAEPVAQVEGAAAGVATASADARSMARELVAVGQQVQLHLPDSVRGSFQKRLPLYVDATLGWGGQAVVLAVAHEVEEDLRPCMLLSQSAAAQEEAPCDWEQLCQLSSSCSAATAADADADADAEPTMQWDAYALKVALPWEWRHKRGGPKWQEERRKYYKDCSDALWREYRLLTKASGCDNIVRCYAWGLVRVPGYDLHLPALLLEHCDGGSLADRLWPLPAPTEQAQAGKHQSAPPELPRQPMTYEEARGYVTQVCHAVCHLNSKHIAHRDLKAGNVLTKKLADGTEQVKLADLGLAWDFSSSTATNKHGYTPTHRAPEAVAGSWCYPNVDCWGVGQLLLELREARAPFWYLLERKGLTEEERQRRRSPEELDNPDSDYYGRLEALEKAVVQDCLQPLLQKRPPLSELLLRHKKYFGLSDDGP